MTEFPTTEAIPTGDFISEEIESKSTSTRPGRSGIVYDEAGNQWDAEEYERKQKNPYRWFIEKQREKQKAKGPSQDEQAASAMVRSSHSIRFYFRNCSLLLSRKHVFELLLNNSVLGYTISVVKETLMLIQQSFEISFQLPMIQNLHSVYQ